MAEQQLNTPEIQSSADLSLVSSDKALAEWRIQADIAEAIINEAPDTELDWLRLQETIVKTPIIGVRGIHPFLKDVDVEHRIRDFNKTHGTSVDPLEVRANLANRARWQISGHNPDHYNPDQKVYIERSWREAATAESEAKIAQQRRDRALEEAKKILSPVA